MENIAVIFFLILAAACVAPYFGFRKLAKFLEGILGLCCLIGIFLIFPFMGILNVFLFFLVGCLVIMLIAAWINSVFFEGKL